MYIFLKYKKCFETNIKFNNYFNFKRYNCEAPPVPDAEASDVPTDDLEAILAGIEDETNVTLDPANGDLDPANGDLDTASDLDPTVDLVTVNE